MVIPSHKSKLILTDNLIKAALKNEEIMDLVGMLEWYGRGFDDDRGGAH